MDPEKLKQFADVQFERSVYKKTLRENATARLTVAHNGGLFTVSPAFIAFLSASSTDTVYIEDTYNNPISVKRQELLKQAQELYEQVMKEWADELEKSNQIRRAEHV